MSIEHIFCCTGSFLPMRQAGSLQPTEEEMEAQRGEVTSARLPIWGRGPQSLVSSKGVALPIPQVKN